MVDTSKLKYAKTHEWIRLEGTRGTVGVTDHAQHEISDVVFVELPKLDKMVKQGASAMVVESVKAAFDIYAPVSGKIVKINDRLKNQPDLVNKSPFEDGWLFEVECTDPGEMSKLLSEEEYKKL